MSLVSNEDEFTYDVEVAVKDNEYYKSYTYEYNK